MKYKKSLLILLMGCWLCVLCVDVRTQSDSASHLILIDGSGSMEGFFITDGVGRLHRVLRRSASLVQTRYFIDYDLVEDVPADTFGGNTYLKHAFDRSFEYSPKIVWLVTDNQPSTGGQTESDRDLDQFYEQLRSDRVKRIYLFPLKLSFNGDLYLRQPDGSEYARPYNGLRGLLVYALLMDDSARSEFNEAVSQLEEALRNEFPGQNIRGLLIKPLRDTVSSRLMPGKGLLVGKNGGIEGRNFEEGKPIDGNIILELTSELGQIAINDASIDVKAISNFQTASFNVPVPDPQISPKEIESFQPGEKKTFTINLHLDSIKIKSDPLSLWKCITNNSGYVEGEISIQIKAPPQNFTVVRSIANEFSTDGDVYRDTSPRTQERIYALNQLIQKLIPSEDEVMIRPTIGNNPAGIIPVILEVKYPRWPTLLVVGGILLPLLAIIGGALWIKRQPLYRLTWDNGSYRACGDFRLWPFMAKPIEVDNRTAAKLTRTPLSGISVVAGSGYTIDDAAKRPVRADGSDFVLSRNEDQASVVFSLSFAVSPSRESDYTKDADDDIEYGYTESADSVGSSRLGPPPIRKATTDGASGGDSSGRSSSNDSYKWDY